jgi:hypothetical protein
MIKAARVLSGYPSELPALKDRDFVFIDGINFLFGPNGCGKSSLLRTIAAYSFIEKSHGGWSRRPSFVRRGNGDYPHALSAWAPGEAKADVEWDGTPSFMLDAQLIAPTMTHLEFTPEDSYDGLTDLQTQLILMKSSQGQMTLTKLARAKAMLDGPVPDILELLGKNAASDEGRARIAYLEGLSRDGRPTLFLDEPDRSLSLPYQRNFFHGLLIELAAKFQIICATHSPMCFYVPGAVYHDLEDGYVKEAQVLMHFAFGDDKLKAMLVLGRDWQEKYGKKKEEKKEEGLPA